MKKGLGDYIADILDAVQEVEEFTEGMNFETFLTDKKTINPVIRSLEVIGEAAKHIPEDVRGKYPDIPQKRMAGIRDKLIHEYSGVDLEIIWSAIKEELPPIEPLIEKVLKDMEKED